MKNKATRNNMRGLSLMEMLVTVLILMILFALAMIPISKIQKNLRQTELDSRAEMIFSAVQSRMTRLQAAGQDSYYQPTGMVGAAELMNMIPKDAEKDKYKKTTLAYVTSADKNNKDSAASWIYPETEAEAPLDSVVGGFIGIGDKEMDIEKGGSAAEQIDYHGENYALQATSLKAEDLKNLKVDGNTYTFEVENATSPQTDKSTAMSRLTNDILTQSMVDSEIKNFISAAKINSATIEYTNIKATVVIEDGNLKEFKYSYDGNVAELNIKVAFISVNGKGAMHVEGAYTNFAY